MGLQQQRGPGDPRPCPASKQGCWEVWVTPKPLVTAISEGAAMLA